MQQNRHIRIQEADTNDTRLQDASAALNAKEAPYAFVPPATEPLPFVRELPHTDSEPTAAPLVRMPVGYVVQVSEPEKGVSPGEKQALVGGFFVMFSLAAALAIGWWMTPATPSSTSTYDRHARDTRPTVAPLGQEDAQPPEFHERAAMNEVLIDIEREPVEEVSVLPPAPPPDAASAQNQQGMPSPLTRERPSPPKGEDKTDSPRATQHEGELQRLKAQADSENNGNRLGSPPSEPARNKSSSAPDHDARSRRVDLREAVAKCRNEQGIFFQERCKWRLCNGRWGKYGCPSYDNEPHAGQTGMLNRYSRTLSPNKKARQISLSRFDLFS